MPIVTDGLIGYWHYQQGVSGSTWENIAPATKGQYDGTINGAILQSDGMYFDGVDDYIDVAFTEIDTPTIEMGLVVEKAQAIPFVVSSNISSIYLTVGSANTSVSYYVGTFILGKGSFANNILTNLTIFISNKMADFYKNGVANNDGTPLSSDFKIGNQINIGRYHNNTDSIRHFHGKIMYVRLYNRILTPQEIQQNYEVGTAIGLDEEPPPQEPPKPTVINISRNTISDEPNMDRATVTFTFDQDVTEWKVNVLGSSHDTGTLADSGGAVTQGTEITAEIDYTELYQEGQNRINIYGKNGEWTPCE